MGLKEALGKQSTWTWNTIDRGRQKELVMHEETLTDMNLLDIAYEGGVKVVTDPQTHHEESLSGADWEWTFFDNPTRTIFVLVQAKKLDPRTDAYNSLDHRVKSSGELQVDLLIKAAASRKPVIWYPVYVLYNWWMNGRSPADDGCRIASASAIKGLIDNRQKSRQAVFDVSKPWTGILSWNGADGYAGPAAEFLASLSDDAPPELLTPRPVPDEMRENGADGPPTRPIGLAPRLVVFGAGVD